VGLQDLDKARETMRELEKIVGTGGASLTRIYLDLGKELQKEVERLQAARDPRLAEVLKSFESFLDDISKRKEGQDFNSLIWVAETYRTLGYVLQKDDSGKAEGYYARAVTALQQLLDEEQQTPGFIPADGVRGVKFKMALCRRRQRDLEEARLEGRLTDLERDLTSALQELQEIRRLLRKPIGVTVIPLKHLDPKSAARSVGDVIGDKHKDVTIEADVKTNSLIVHADAETTELGEIAPHRTR
jgi:hypothetical protein